MELTARAAWISDRIGTRIFFDTFQGSVLFGFVAL